jgi:hypothetical protein
LARLRRELDRWLRNARAGGLDKDGIDALYHAAMRDTLLGGEGVA